MIDAHWYEIIWVIFTAFAGMIAIGAGMIGYWMRKVFWFERILAALSGLLLIYPEGYTDMIGLGIFLLLFILQLIWKRDRSRPEEIPALKA
ncbi:hypothetical protein [Bacillus sonorensis]|nr:hypothetical protein [Bacillus sonorensis]MCY8564259.1 hypothetical protein [Bacillus sonorensis]